MGYCTVDDVRRILPPSIRIGDNNVGKPSPGRPGDSRSVISANDTEYYIEYANQYVDSRLRQFYFCPLRRIKEFETSLVVAASPGSDVSTFISDTGSFSRGDLVRIQDKFGMEITTVDSVTDRTTMVLTSVANSYEVDSGKVSIVTYPDPIPVITARLACSYIIDRLFVAEQSPDVSTYGKTQRNLARGAIDDVLAGVILLFGQDHVGRRFVRGSLFESFAAAVEVNRGEDRE